MKCKIQWIDCRGFETPDENEAVGYAVVYSKLFDEYQRYPICTEHLKSLNQVHHGNCKHTTTARQWAYEEFKDAT